MNDPVSRTTQAVPHTTPRRWPKLPRPGREVLREVLLASLPLLLSVTLFALTSLPAFRALSIQGEMNSFYDYQGLVQDIQTYQIDLLTRDFDPQERADARDRVLSRTQVPAQFVALEEVEQFGDARLSHIDQLVRSQTPASVGQALAEAIQLNAQASSYLTDLTARTQATLRLMHLILLGTAALTGLLSMTLIGRVLWLRRAEQQQQLVRDARQREALNLASHELRRPLQQLLLSSELLRQVENPEQRHELLLRIEDCAAQIANRADLSRLNDLYLDVNLRLASHDLVPLLRTLGSTNARVQLSLPTSMIWDVDADRLRQMVENLLENALKYTVGPVELRLQRWHGVPEITVRDYGEGISKALLERVFLPYERGPQGLIQGQGLGLSLVRRYARAHGGEVTLHPAPNGSGTLALLRLGQPQRRPLED